jgi:hypothetical protein
LWEDNDKDDDRELRVSTSQHPAAVALFRWVNMQHFCLFTLWSTQQQGGAMVGDYEKSFLTATRKKKLFRIAKIQN